MEITTTIIIPNYNGLKFMDECIRSLNAQTYPNFRTLVVDNGSTDGSVEWLKEHQIDSDFPAGKHGIFRRSQRRNQGGRHTVCAAFK